MVSGRAANRKGTHIMRIIRAKDYADMSRKAANIISAQVILFPKSVLGLATGSTPVGVYRVLTDWYEKGDIDFSKVRTVNLDEYCGISPDHEQSYRYFMNQNFFNHVNIDKANTYVPDGLAADYEQECIRYENLITGLGGTDLQLLGLGHDGHIGFNEPGKSFIPLTHKAVLSRRTIEANARFFGDASKVPQYAVTMGIRTIMKAPRIVMVVSGEDKAGILWQTVNGPITPDVPASVIQLHTDAVVVADEAALKLFPSAD